MNEQENTDKVIKCGLFNGKDINDTKYTINNEIQKKKKKSLNQPSGNGLKLQTKKGQQNEIFKKKKTRAT